MKNILILTAHDDDEILGTGGAIQYYKNNNYKIYICQVTDGSSAQYTDNQKLINERNTQHKEALYFLKIDEFFCLNFPDMQLDTVPHYKINNKINEVFQKIKPEILFTHSNSDINKDHQLVFESSLIISRPLNNFLKMFLCYEVPSSTNWNPEENFVPNHFINIENYIDNKIKAFSIMKTEIRDYPHPRSLEGLKIQAQYRGMQSGSKFSEAFKIIKNYE